MILLNGPLRTVQGVLSAAIAYPIAERLEKRFIREKREELREFYRLRAEQRQATVKKRLVELLQFASTNVPYYRDLFVKLNFQPNKLCSDLRYLEDIPYLTKNIIREQGSRLLSADVSQVRHHLVKTGGSTGPACHLYYDQEAADYAAAVILYARERVGKKKHKFETHFACQFPHEVPSDTWTREDWKCLAMNRTNIFFGRLTKPALEDIWLQLKNDSPFLAHAHPSTMLAIADYVGSAYGGGKAFDVFESSGESLSEEARIRIRDQLNCCVVNRFGLAEFGVIGYELGGDGSRLDVLESEGWAESVPVQQGSAEDDEELIFTGFRNRLMPLIRYRTGDYARVHRDETGVWMSDVIGRIHDIVEIDGTPYPTHHIQDILDHRIGGIRQFQVDVRGPVPVLKLVLEADIDAQGKIEKIKSIWPKGLEVEVISFDEIQTVGRHAKFRYVISV